MWYYTISEKYLGAFRQDTSLKIYIIFLTLMVNDMKFRIVILLASFFLSNVSFADLPTPHSDPLPKISETKNIDVRLTEEVQKKISQSPHLKDQPVSAAARQGVVILQGSVQSKHQERIAVTLAKSVKGVKKVKSQLTIRKSN